MSCIAFATRIHLCKSSSNVPRMPSFLKYHKISTQFSGFARFWQGGEPLAPATQNSASMSKSGPEVVCLSHVDFEMSFAPHRRALFQHLNFQIALRLRCFVHIDFDVCFAPQWPTLFRHLNFQEWSENGVLCASWLPHVLWATTARTSSTSQLPEVL